MINKETEVKKEIIYLKDNKEFYLVVYVILIVQEKINYDFQKELDEEWLGVKYILFKWVKSETICKGLETNYCNKNKLRVEILNGINTDNIVISKQSLGLIKIFFKVIHIKGKKIFTDTE